MLIYIEPAFCSSHPVLTLTKETERATRECEADLKRSVNYIKEDHIAIGISIVAIDSVEPLRELDVAELLPQLRVHKETHGFPDGLAVVDVVITVQIQQERCIGLAGDGEPLGELVEDPREGEPDLADDRGEPEGVRVGRAGGDTEAEEEDQDEEAEDDHDAVGVDPARGDRHFPPQRLSSLRHAANVGRT
ncbi:hypothetical protein BHM03_00000279 [Ensete ventricosum]|nr:hypothetical protein BHM03_00000279 [Ensete ventricosum]